MELKTFAEDDFEPKKWINKAWGSSGNQDKEVFVANTVSRLHLYMKQLTNSLDETTTQIVTSVPRILHDASALQTEGALLQHQLVTLERKVVGVEEQTGHSIESLQRIDQLKSRLENAASALREADKWAALASSLEDTLDAGVPTQRDKLAELAGQVAAMTGSLEVLVDAPDYEEKRLQMETLYNRLEAAVSAPLIDALTQMNADRARTYVSLWAAMRRTDSLLASWRRAAAAAAAAAWARMDAHSLPALRQTVATQATTQVDWLTDVLKSETPLLELVRLYTELLTSLDPTPTKVLTANIKLCSTPQEAIEFLIDVRTELDQFVATFTTLLEAPRQNRESVPPPALRELGRAVWAPLRALLPQFTELQTQLFNSHLTKERRDQEDLLEGSRALQGVVERSERWMRAGLASALKIAGRAALAYYVPTVENVASTLTTDISAHTRRIEASFHASPSSLGVLSASFPAAVALGTAVGSLLDILAAVMKAVGDEEQVSAPPASPLQVSAQLLPPAPAPPAAGAGAALRRAGDVLRSLAVNILREPVMKQLDTIPSLPVWSDNDALSTDLPDYALSPQEYITEIGQYLMTLPQHLEMHLSEKQAPWQFLTEVCNNTCEVYAEKIMTVKNMDALGTKRCLTDIVYLSSVVEDLGSSITPSLKNLERSLRVTAAPAAPAQA